MSTLSSQNGALQAGINHHMRRLRPRTSQPKSNASGVAVQPRSLYFDVDTLGKAAASKSSVQKISKKKRQNKLDVSVSGPTGLTLTFKLNNDWTVGELKELVEDEEGFAPAEQRLLLDGSELEDEMTLGECVGKDSALDLELKLRGGCVAYEMHKECFDDQFHIDFTDGQKQRCYRGGSSYTLPLGSMRYALKVLDKYVDNTWLGIYNRGNERSCPGEWPVAYHGTTDPRAAEIVQSGGFDLSKGVAFAYGYGIYCTPDPEIALSYATPYQHNGNSYKLILQARVDPSRREVIPHMNYWIAKENDAIRPYGICVYPCD